MSWDQLEGRIRELDALTPGANPVDKMVAGMLIHVQEFIRTSRSNIDFMDMNTAELISLAKRMAGVVVDT